VDADVATVAALLGEPARAEMLLALTEVDALPATDLARRARVSAPTASAHLAKLVDAALVTVEPHGRHRYYRLADPAVAHALEALAVIAPERPVRSLRDATVGDALRAGRTCYDHLAGQVGVAVTDALAFRRREAELVPTRTTRLVLDGLGIRLDAVEPGRRVLARPCLDWSERRYHVAGALGAAIAARLFELRWIERLPGSRAVRVTRRGAEKLAELGVSLR
jgi:DNA-binding transcriptional ArsR family regulator